jgi:MoxR-like ATPase
MFTSWEVLHQKLRDTGYFIAPELSTVVWLAITMQRPLLLEGQPAPAKPN